MMQMMQISCSKTYKYNICICFILLVMENLNINHILNRVEIADEIKKIPEIMRKEYNLLNTNIHDEVLKTIVLSIDLYNLLYEEVVEEKKGGLVKILKAVAKGAGAALAAGVARILKAIALLTVFGRVRRCRLW